MILALILIGIYFLSFGVIAGYMLRFWEEGAEYEDAWAEYEDALAVTFEDEQALLASERWPYDYEANDDPTMG